MKPSTFKYLVPDSVEDVIGILNSDGADAKLLAGGQSLIPAMNFRVMAPSILVDLNPLKELNFIRPTSDGGVTIGAMTRQRQIERDKLIATRAPLLYETMPFIAHPQIRNRGTIGGSLVHADPAAELPVICLILEARLKARGAQGERWINANEWFQFLFTTDIQPDEILIEIEFPPMPEGAGYAFEEFSRRHGDYALMGVAALVTLDQEGKCNTARITYLNASDVPVLANQAGELMIGTQPSEALFLEAAETASAHEIEPMGSVHTSPEYQRHLAKVLTLRVLRKAFARARGG